MAIELTEQEILQKIAADAISAYRSKTSGPLVANPMEYTDASGKRLDNIRVPYIPYPKMLYKGSETKIVTGEHEHKAASLQGWQETPIKRPIWDIRKQEVGFSLNEHHLSFLVANGFDIKTIEEAKAYFDGLEDAAKEIFLRDAAAWILPEPQKRGPGRPPKDAA